MRDLLDSGRSDQLHAFCLTDRRHEWICRSYEAEEGGAPVREGGQSIYDAAVLHRSVRACNAMAVYSLLRILSPELQALPLPPANLFWTQAETILGNAFAAYGPVIGPERNIYANHPPTSGWVTTFQPLPSYPEPASDWDPAIEINPTSIPTDEGTWYRGFQGHLPVTGEQNLWPSIAVLRDFPGLTTVAAEGGDVREYVKRSPTFTDEVEGKLNAVLGEALRAVYPNHICAVDARRLGLVPGLTVFTETQYSPSGEVPHITLLLVKSPKHEE